MRESAPMSTSARQAWQEAWFREFPQTEKKIILNLPGRITSWKGIESFIDLFSYLDTSRFHGIIPGPVARNKRNYLRSLKAIIKQKNLTNHITISISR